MFRPNWSCGSCGSNNGPTESTVGLVTATMVEASPLDFVLSRSFTKSDVGVATGMTKMTTAVVAKVTAAALLALFAHVAASDRFAMPRPHP